MAYVVGHNARRGTAAVEAALMLPIVMLMTFGLLTYGWVFIRSGQINNAARQGARVAARADVTNHDVTNQVVEDHIVALMGTAGIPFNAASDLTVVVADLPADADGVVPGTTVTVTITVAYRGTDAELISMGAFMPVPEQLQSTATMFKRGSGRIEVG